VAERHSELGIDTENIVVTGASGEGNLAAAMALAARGRRGPGTCAQLLCYRILGDRIETSSYKRFANKGLWLGERNIASSNKLFGERWSMKDVSIYEAPHVL
jgi:acetyl esterase